MMITFAIDSINDIAYQSVPLTLLHNFSNLRLVILFPLLGCSGEGPSIYYSADSAANERSEGLYPPEFLNTLNPQGLPSHKVLG